jgi:hypothetical protein
MTGCELANNATTRREESRRAQHALMLALGDAVPTCPRHPVLESKVDTVEATVTDIATWAGNGIKQDIAAGAAPVIHAAVLALEARLATTAIEAARTALAAYDETVRKGNQPATEHPAPDTRPLRARLGRFLHLDGYTAADIKGIIAAVAAAYALAVLTANLARQGRIDDLLNRIPAGAWNSLQGAKP